MYKLCLVESSKKKKKIKLVNSDSSSSWYRSLTEKFELGRTWKYHSGLSLLQGRMENNAIGEEM